MTVAVIWAAFTLESHWSSWSTSRSSSRSIMAPMRFCKGDTRPPPARQIGLRAAGKSRHLHGLARPGDHGIDPTFRVDDPDKLSHDRGNETALSEVRLTGVAR